MRRKQLWLVIAGLILLNCLTIAFFLSRAQATDGQALDEEVATIGESSISRQDWLNELEARYGKDVLKDMIDQKVIKEMAAKYKIKVPDQDVEREFRMIQTTYGSASQNKIVNEKKWKEQIENSLLLEEILTKDVIVSNKEMESYFKENKDLFDVPTAYHLSHIIVKSKKEANNALKELSHGSSFSTLAMERSIEEFSANQGGDIGFITEEDDQHPEKYIQEAKRLKVGEWSHLIKVDQGYAIIKLHKIIHGKNYSFKDVKDQIRRQIAMEQMKIPATARNFWDDAKVKWFYGKQRQ
ncbi:peptidyl-prolyl cis-trans isomerase [Neobacillus sp. PS3-40]|uniref:peptidyl-prolyl cis-trans isomerase n=1 Tax=Neobacillus sp. PS3-40 TaxID=3070679 RepID=UPI0027E0E395|nr:peptidyl-prolyl cis-trans isomerase [Neobacillus sp. PS3-40]WML42539.1 peptidyl-prolyl cis-trans isomerase [Neobacillus sp. PS3-40]